MDKQDRQGVRTPADLERKYNFDKRFTEIMGIASDARDSVDRVESVLRDEIKSQVTSITRDTEQIILSALEDYVKTGDLETYQETVRAEIAVRADEISMSVSEMISEYVKNEDFETYKKEASSQLDMKADEISMSVSETVSTCVKNEDFETYKETASAEIAVRADQVSVSVSETVRSELSSVSDQLQAQINEIRMNYDFTADGQYIGKKDSDTMLRLVNDMMQILVSGVAATTVDKTGLTADEANIRTLHMGEYTLALGEDGHLMLT